jgi:rod shape-determining protein MreD
VIRVVRLLVALWLLVVLQTTLVPEISIGSARPDLPFLLVLLVALHEGAAGGALAGFFAGMFVDLESARHLGTSSLATSLVGFATGILSVHLVRNSVATRVIVAFVATVVKGQLVVLVASPADLAGGFRHFVQSSLPGGLYTALLAPIVMMALEWIVGWSRESGRGIR